MSKQPTKKRYQITLSPHIAKAGRRIARLEHRSFSNLLESLIAREGEAEAKAGTSNIEHRTLNAEVGAGV